MTWARQQTFARGTTPNPVELRVQRVDGDGALPWGEGGILIHSFATRRYDQAMASDGMGGAYVFWLDDRAPGVYAQHITEAGKILWAADGIPVATTPFIGLGRPAAVPDGSHGAIVAWSGTSGGRTGVFAARVTPSGALPWRGAGEVFRAGSSQIDGLRMVPARAGGAVLAWRASQRGANDRILAQRLDHAGRREWPENAVTVCAASGTRDHVALASDRRGGAYVAWLDSRPAFGVFAMHLERTGEPARGWPSDGAPVCARLPLPAPAGGLVEFSALEITTIEEPSFREGRRDLDDAGDPASQEALGDDEQYRSMNDMKSAAPDENVARHRADAMVAWVDDRTPYEAGSRFRVPSPFAMLLTPRGPATAPIAAFQLPILVSQPEYSRVALSAPSLSLAGPRAAGQQIVRLTLPDVSPASLELFDLAGRKLWSRDVGGLGPGVHEVILGDAAYPSGVYMARLTQGSRTARAHVAVIH